MDVVLDSVCRLHFLYALLLYLVLLTGPLYSGLKGRRVKRLGLNGVITEGRVGPFHRVKDSFRTDVVFIRT